MSASQEQSHIYGLRPAALSRPRFILTVYSITATALMVFAADLAAEQRLQFFLLRHLTSDSRLHPSYHSQIASSPSTQEASFGAGNRQDPSSYPTSYSPLHQNHHDHSSSQLQFSRWLPFLIWLTSWYLWYIVFRSRSWIPSVISARKGILAGISISTLICVLLGVIQEVLEQQFAKRGDALRGMNFDQIDGQTKDQMVKGLLELNTDLQVMALPLWAGWFSSLVLLGGAAGMLATSMRVLRQQLEEEYHVAEEMQAMEEKRIAGVKEKFDGAVQAVAESSSSPLPIEYTTRECWIMTLLVAALYYSQIKLSQWVFQSLDAYQTGTKGSVTMWIVFGGLMVGAAMISFGMQHLPRPRS